MTMVGNRRRSPRPERRSGATNEPSGASMVRENAQRKNVGAMPAHGACGALIDPGTANGHKGRGTYFDGFTRHILGGSSKWTPADAIDVAFFTDVHHDLMLTEPGQIADRLRIVARTLS